ncbi:hypothetical protein OsI_28443 [Oryza sativa Indica Group]|uniref:Uncharacterized protein n=1 Tax=Oryza sativa subsp. indica TaxID=39946 RepID=A2YSZ2_ORYSI|nr:hypothetical protein OsI_28443 [Oryza sativa Indica Group]
MGIVFTRLFSSVFGNREARILVLGLDNAGKTTILYRLQMGEVVSTIPTIGFNVETVQYNNIKFQVWDLGECAPKSLIHEDWFRFFREPIYKYNL